MASFDLSKSLEERLAEEAKLLREEASLLPAGAVRDATGRNRLAYQRMAALARPAPANTMSRPVDELLKSIMDDFAVGKQTQAALEAKALFRLLNYCPPPALDMGQHIRHRKASG